MTQMNPDRITDTISITVLPQDNGQYVCQILSSLGDRSNDCTHFYGQTKEHAICASQQRFAIANALEQLADDCRKLAEDSQDIDSLAVELSESGVPIEKHYHGIGFCTTNALPRQNLSLRQCTICFWEIRWLKMPKSQ
jgi:hypothetical protein